MNNFIILQGNKKQKALNRKHLEKMCSLTILLLETMRDQDICCFFNTQIQRFNVLFPIFVYSENFIFQSCSINVILKNIYSVRLRYSCASMTWSNEIRQIKYFKTISMLQFQEYNIHEQSKILSDSLSTVLFTLLAIDYHQRVWAIEADTANDRKLGIGPVHALAEVINRQPYR